MIIKYIPEDFIVQEVLVTDHTPQDTGQPYILLNLDKKGWSTFDAEREVESWFSISGLASAGLKDSDGITSQKISVPAEFRKICQFAFFIFRVNFLFAIESGRRHKSKHCYEKHRHY